MGVGVAVAVCVGLAVGVAVGVGVAVSVGRPLGSGVAPVSTEHLALLIRQPVGSAAVPSEVVTKPTVADLPGASSLFQSAGFTVTWLPLTVCSPFQRELILVPAGRSNSSVQSVWTLSVSLVTTYCPV